MLIWSIIQQRLDLRYTWKISRNASTEKHNLFVTVSDGSHSGQGEIAPNIRYGESVADTLAHFDQFVQDNPETISSVDELRERIRTYPNSLRFGLESAYLFYLCHKQGKTLSSLLNLPPPTPIPTSYTLPIMEPGEIGPFIRLHNLDRFSLLKLKVNQENAVELTRALFAQYGKPICIDANEAFKDPETVTRYLEEVSDIPLLFLEQPLPAREEEAGVFLKTRSPVPIFADESVTSNPDMKKIATQFHGINMKLMKAGGFLHGIDILKEAGQQGLSTMIGCMIETSIGIRSAMYLTPLCQYYDLDGMFLLKDEPFNLVKEQTGYLFL